MVQLVFSFSEQRGGAACEYADLVFCTFTYREYEDIKPLYYGGVTHKTLYEYRWLRDSVGNMYFSQRSSVESMARDWAEGNTGFMSEGFKRWFSYVEAYENCHYVTQAIAMLEQVKEKEWELRSNHLPGLKGIAAVYQGRKDYWYREAKMYAPYLPDDYFPKD